MSFDPYAPPERRTGPEAARAWPLVPRQEGGGAAPPPPPGRTAVWVGAALGSVAVLLVVAVVAGLLVSRARRPSAGVEPRTRARITAALPGLESFVERTRGLHFASPPEVDIASPRAFADAAADARRVSAAPGDRPAPVTLRALGQVRDVDAYRASRDRALRAVPAFYDLGRRRLVVDGGRWDPSVQAAVVTALTVAVQDAAFDLRGAIARTGADESGWALAALSAGDARRVRSAYVRAQTDRWRATLQRREAADDDALDDPVGRAVLASQRGPAATGEAFAAALLSAGGRPRLDRAFTAPPRTSEQLLDPDGWQESAPRLRPQLPSAPEPEPGSPALDRGVLGVSGLALLAGLPGGSRAMAGWAGDRYTTWASGSSGRSCTTVAIAFDDRAARDRALGALRTWVARDGTGAERTGTRSLRLDACS